jgi:hypothetical protein
MTIRHFVVMQNDYPASIVLGTREEAAEFEAQLKKNEEERLKQKNENQQKRYYHLHEFEPKYIKGNKMRNALTLVLRASASWFSMISR